MTLGPRPSLCFLFAALICISISFMPNQFHAEISTWPTHVQRQLTFTFEIHFHECSANQCIALIAMFFVGTSVLFTFWIALTRSVSYIPFKTPLNFCKHPKPYFPIYRLISFYFFLSVWIMALQEEFIVNFLIMSIYVINPISYVTPIPRLQVRLPLKAISFIFIFSCATSQAEQFFSISIIFALLSIYSVRCRYSLGLTS